MSRFKVGDKVMYRGVSYIIEKDYGNKVYYIGNSDSFCDVVPEYVLFKAFKYVVTNGDEIEYFETANEVTAFMWGKSGDEWAVYSRVDGLSNELSEMERQLNENAHFPG